MAERRTETRLVNVGWYLASLSLLVLAWEAAWYFGLITSAVLPPPHVFLGEFPQQVANFQTAEMVGVQASSAYLALALTVLATISRVLAGLALGFVLGVLVGGAIHYWSALGKLLQPMITLLAPISPIAWLPIAVGTFGIGNGPAIFLVFVTVFFIIVVSTVADLDGVKPQYVQVARVMGASKFQLYRRVLFPAILPGLFLTIRLNMFAAWMMVLVAEAAGVGSGIGMVTNLARNTANSSLVFICIMIIGVVALIFDLILKEIQTKTLYWMPSDRAELVGN
ncbi:ABC transporter permease [Nordella sp. HKS 07]|uniref:ABC transporter permease n=1 Tax=Nordella sp. HKS 07 TaxID=2712222 RepID=UPI0013E207E0|nr:ABC transporter permease [Nordella sp. HKS 07]QIG50448.1 ABC transporter permease [Nordella sp. HKS 07]